MTEKEIKWLPAEDNPWNVPVLDLRPVISQMLATSKDPEKARNAVSYGSDDGLSFKKKKPPINRKIKTSIVYPTENDLLDGVLFTPNTMEHKWAIFYHDKRIIFVRSWLREVRVVAKVIQKQNGIEVTEIHGVFTSEEEPPELTELYLDFLIRNLVYRMVYPVPISKELAKFPQKAAIWCFSIFGNISLVATPHPIPEMVISQPMISNSLFHIAVARGDFNSVKKFIEKRIPIDILAKDGFSPLHWALFGRNLEMAGFLLQNGANINCPSDEGATPLMMAVQHQNLEAVQFFIEKGADINKGDNRGFTSLHRSAEMGNLSITTLLLNNGGDPTIKVQGHSPITLAEGQNHHEIVKILRDHM
jgi:hypothetical protein